MNYNSIEISDFYTACRKYFKENKNHNVKFLHRIDGPAIEHYDKKHSYFDQYYINGICICEEDYEKEVDKYIKEQVFK